MNINELCWRDMRSYPNSCQSVPFFLRFFSFSVSRVDEGRLLPPPSHPPAEHQRASPRHMQNQQHVKWRQWLLPHLLQRTKIWPLCATVLKSSGTLLHPPTPPTPPSAKKAAARRTLARPPNASRLRQLLQSSHSAFKVPNQKTRKSLSRDRILRRSDLSLDRAICATEFCQPPLPHILAPASFRPMCVQWWLQVYSS